MHDAKVHAFPRCTCACPGTDDGGDGDDDGGEADDDGDGSSENSC